ncbi:FAD-binding oxidoreductase [Rhizobium sp. TH2]|uniref:NAD(P)/FAD-dependent oxidoreductase n=1 Tax=Rhizobium sp. TH2 TaxID=2775403 RepID=UPI0021581A18|nr:FAD-binding oxidoreductase [Rhizobium sp. TH2]UVC09752.1 FAD-binding oxidoreductase [Rhizobium sp. TH2]
MSVTKKRDLHTDTPLWSLTPRIGVRSHAVPLKQYYDVVIVGTGISGALMAHALADGTRSLLVIDRRKPVGGSSLASTAMIQHEIDVPLGKLQQRIGKAKAKRVWARSMDAVEKLASKIEYLNIGCGFARKRALFLSGDEMGWRALRDEAGLRNGAGFDAQFIDAAALRSGYGIDRTGAILTDCSASANPAQMTAEFLRQAVRGGAELVCGPEVMDISSKSGEVELVLSSGETLRCGNAVFCTGYEFLDSVARADHSIISTWAIATRANAPRPEWLDDCLVWEAADPYLYMRTTSDGRIVAGGEDEDDPRAHEDQRKLKAKQKTIARKVSTLLGCQIGEIEFAWAGAFGVTPTGLPIIDEVPGMRHVFTVMGYGGNGITFSQIASEIISAKLSGHRDKDFDLFRFGAAPAPRKAA